MNRSVLTSVSILAVVISFNGAWGNSMTLENEWYVVNDGVMGGVSRSHAEMTPAGTMVFSGVVSLENNGGFASTRHAVEAFAMNNGEGVSLRIKGDGKIYQFRVRTSNRFDGVAYKVEFHTIENQWQDVRFTWDQFIPTFRGRIVEAPPLDASRIEQLGFLIAGKQAGGFQLEIESISPM